MKHIRKLMHLPEVPQPTFVELVQEYFGFLVDEFGFSLSSKMIKSSKDPFVDSVVEFRTSQTIVTMDLDRSGTFYVFLGSTHAKVPPDYYQTTTLGIVDFLSHGKDQTLHNLWLKRGKKWREWVELQIIEEAKALRKYGHQIFDKESFEWLDLIRNNKEQAQRLYESTPNKTNYEK